MSLPSNQIKPPENFILTDEFTNAITLIENSPGNLFITGKAGTGKSTLLQYFRERTKKNIIVLAPTGVAAVNVKGQTIHSFFQFPPKLIEKENITRLYKKMGMIRKLDMIIIDEVSMVRADLMEGIDQILRLTRGQQHLPFGGVKMVLFGDLYQLPPVVRNDVKVYFEDHYGSPYFFSAEVFNNTPLKIIELERVFRQQDLYFKELLDSIRNATITEDQLDTLNERCVWDDLPVEKSGTVHLTTRNDMAEKINAERLAALSRNEYNYAGKITGRFDEKIFPTELNLELKEGAQVMIIRNDPNRRWINGTIGIITDLQKKKVIVASDGKELEVKTSTWENVEYKYDRKAGTIVENVKGTFKQFPLRLAWAFTIHKSQGKTFDKVIVDLGRGAFAHGQTYVALSRCVSLEGITLLNPVKPEDVMVDERITRFLEGNSRVKF